MAGVDAQSLEVGMTLPTFERDVGFANWNRYAAVNDEFVPIHMDDEAGQTAGYPTAFGMGNLQVAYLHCVLRDWLGDRGRVERLAVQFRSPALRGSRNIAGGVITRVDRDPGGSARAELDVWVDDDTGARLTPGTATVVIEPDGADDA